VTLKTSHSIATGSGLNLVVETARTEKDLAVTVQAPVTKPCWLHWGIRAGAQKGWAAPQANDWPPGTKAYGENAVQTPFAKSNGQAKVVIHLPTSSEHATLEFALFFPDEKRWDNNGGRNYQVPLAGPEAGAPDPLVALRADSANNEAAFERVFELENSCKMAVLVTKSEDQFRVRVAHNLPGDWLLHWGIARRSPREWLAPPENMGPAGTTLAKPGAGETPFNTREGLSTLEFVFAEPDAPLGLQFVLRQAGQGARWLNFKGGNFYVPVKTPKAAAGSAGPGALAGLADEIIRAETTHNSWTLMHRFNLCHDLLDRVQGNPEGLALIFVWLRFSAIRQLTWQRSYNTKPRELAHSQDRLTQKLAAMYRTGDVSRPWVRLILTTVGRGGEGQRIRDEILNIMHRHHIKEVSGHFLEEWHQKLHNNTTPDDIVICEAYLEFLRSGGSRDRFYQVLEAGGVTRQRLESFERPIRSQPDFVPHLKDALLHDFSQFLRIIKAAHSGTDFETALNAARGKLDGGMQGLMDWIAGHRRDGGDGLLHLVNQITEARRRLSPMLNGDSNRALLYLDLALEQLLRAGVEGNIHLLKSGEILADLLSGVVENVGLSFQNPELSACLRHWQRLQSIARSEAEWALHAKSVTDRLARALGGWMDELYRLLQPKAEYLGHGFQAEPWTITLFSEEVVRGGSLGFVVSMLLHQLDPILRQAAHLGDWQIISRGEGTGKLEVVESLHSLQQRKFTEPVVVIVEKVQGDEEIPEGITAVLAPDVTDVVSHVAVRARNNHVLFAACFASEKLQALREMRGRNVRLEITPGGDIRASEAAAPGSPEKGTRPARVQLTTHGFTQYAVSLDEFNEQNVGSKSLNQARLRGKLPESIRLPASCALPFGVFEKVLELDLNRETAERYAQRVQDLQKGAPETLATLRDTVLELKAPPELKSSVEMAMGRAGLPKPDPWDKAWDSIKRVWASKWNDRAVLSRQKMGIPHNSLSMAVLVQEVIPADYAFVIHTVNPANHNSNELFAEVVLGLGETLVGNFPGRALSFVWDKTRQQGTVLSFPGKSVALHGSGLIFRSDSNGEDLAGYAGAGLYDSILAEPAREELLDYSQAPLVWDESFRQELLRKIAELGLEVERVLGSPQDIEGVVSQGQLYLVQTRPQAAG
jgi:alpha-glucan,water dikinase